MKEFTYGAVLRVERQYSMEDIYKMMNDMKDLGLNTIVVWPAVYWWEDEGDNYPYQTGHNILAYAEEIGMSIIMELAGQITSLEYTPDFKLSDDHYPIDAKGNIDKGGMGYGYLNFNHPEIMTMIKDQNSEIASHYLKYTSLKGYDIWNETQFESYDKYTLNLFRQFLESKYKTLDKLNDAWDRVYRSFDQVEFSPWLWASVMPFVDYKQFQKANIGIILSYMKDAVKTVDTQSEILADNIHASVTMERFYNRPQDDWEVASHVDTYGISFYPKFLSKYLPYENRHQTMAGAHSAVNDGKFIVSEMQTHHASMFNPMGHVHASELEMWCYESIAHGGKGIVYWKWDPFIKGVQTYGRGLVDAQGRLTPRAIAAKNVKQTIDSEIEAFNSYTPKQAKVAIMYDKLNHDFSKAYTVGFQGTAASISSSFYLDSLSGLYSNLLNKNVSVKFITPTDFSKDDIHDYKAIFMTNQIVMDDTLAQDITNYISKGGKFIVDGKFAEVNEVGLLNKTIPGSKLSETFGLELLDMNIGNLNMSMNGDDINGYHDRRSLKTTTVNSKTLAQYDDGESAIVEINHEAGKLIYISTFFWLGDPVHGHANTIKLLNTFIDQFDLKDNVTSQDKLIINQLEGSGGDLIFVFNYDEDVETKIEIDSKGRIVESIKNVKENTDITFNQENVISIPLYIEKDHVSIIKINYRDEVIR